MVSLNPIAMMGGGGFTPTKFILNLTNLVDSSKLEFGQNIRLSMANHIILHWLHLSYTCKRYSKIFFSTLYLSLLNQKLLLLPNNTHFLKSNDVSLVRNFHRHSDSVNVLNLPAQKLVS